MGSETESLRKLLLLKFHPQEWKRFCYLHYCYVLLANNKCLETNNSGKLPSVFKTERNASTCSKSKHARKLI